MSRRLLSAGIMGAVLAAGTCWLAGGCGDASICLDTDKWVLFREYDSAEEIFFGYSFSSDGRHFVSAGRDGKIRLYGVATGEIEASWDTLQETLRRAAFSPNRSRVLTQGSHPSLALWDAKSHRLLADSTASDVSVLQISWSPDGKALATVDDARSAIHIWDADSLEIRAELHGHTDFVVNAEFSPDGQYLASIGYDGTVRIWDAKSFKPAAVLQNHSWRILCMAFSPTGDYLVTGGIRSSRKGTVIVWNMQELSLERDLRHNFDVSEVRFSADGRCLVTGDRYNRYAWDTGDWRYLKKRSRKEYPLDMAVYSPDGRNAITMNHRGDDPYTRLLLWKRADGEESGGVPKGIRE
jgi:WD40 repeat protein